jgi:hypothetical protein
MSDAIHSAALADRQKVTHVAKYPNYALLGTPLEHMYGKNVEKLRKIRAAIDPDDVMGLTGIGNFRIELHRCRSIRNGESEK